MTFCAGWLYKDAVFLLADSAVTSRITPVGHNTSIGQVHALIDGKNVEEALLKISHIGDGTAVAFAGDVDRATEIIEFLRENWTPALALGQMVSLLDQTFRVLTEGPSVSLILTRTTGNVLPELVLWDTESGAEAEESDFYAIGSMSGSFQPTQLWQILSEYMEMDVTAEDMLAIAVGVFQSFGVHDDLLRFGVGGVVFGARTEGGVFSWLPDTNFVLHDHKCSATGFVNAIVRDDMLGITSTLQNEMRLFGNARVLARTRRSSTDLLPEFWALEFDARKGGRFKFDEATLWIFLCTQFRTITVIIRSDVKAASRFFRYIDLGNRQFNLELQPELVRVLQMKPAEETWQYSPAYVTLIRDIPSDEHQQG